ncbi:hypothetical protein LCGC14_2376290 [marine sediment metagenome]|uniref:Uncharacterized protein n=1 Tax=marine sediment metagenome TaxID=412755 RepID=A0A0F9C2F7_9ZZZZ
MEKLESLHGNLYDTKVNDLGYVTCPHCRCYLILGGFMGDPDYYHFRCSCCDRDFRMKNKADKDFKII